MYQRIFQLFWKNAFLFLILLFLGGYEGMSQNGTDEANWGIEDINLKKRRVSNNVIQKSEYVTMEDGTPLALDFYLPKSSESKRRPTILFLTRYWRGVDLVFPLNGSQFIPHPRNFDMLEFVRQGYALVTVDVRGTGASFGHKNQGLPDSTEIHDGIQVIDWIVNQSWSNGLVGATGISYIGNASLFLGMEGHPSLKAIAPLYSIFDAYDDAALPGGIFSKRFLEAWNGYCMVVDTNEMPGSKSLVKSIVKGVSPVKGKESMLEQAILDHYSNSYQYSCNSVPEFTDDSTSADGKLRASNIRSPHLFLDELNAMNIPYYSYSGWFDLGFQHAAIRQYLNFDNPQNKLLIGPWSHGGDVYLGENEIKESEFQHFEEILRFFDFHLRKRDLGFSKEPPVRYYLRGKGAWKSAQSWPPEDVKETPIYLKPYLKMDFTPPLIRSDVFTEYSVDTSCGSSPNPRWHLVADKKVKEFPDSRKSNQKMLVFQSMVLEKPLEITGHPRIEFYMESLVPDPAIHVYLEVVDRGGKVKRITEGQLRLIHRKTMEIPAYKDCVPMHSFARADSSLMEKGIVQKVVVDLLPTAYLFPEGSTIQLSIAGADKDYFQTYGTNQDNVFKIFHSEKMPSALYLPIIP